MTKKKYSIILWDWREAAPIAEIIANSKWYSEYYEYHVDDTHYIIFSDSMIKSDQEAEEILALDDEDLDNL